MPQDVMTQAPIPLALLRSGDGNFWKELFCLQAALFTPLVDRLQRVIMLDKAPSTTKAYIAAFQAMASLSY